MTKDKSSIFCIIIIKSSSYLITLSKKISNSKLKIKKEINEIPYLIR